jgi:CRISPR-associated endonuclease/helicase Cas3
MTEYYAHSENANKEKHLLSKHLRATADLMEKFSCISNYGQILKMTGLLHDLGKYQPAFQHYLINGGAPWKRTTRLLGCRVCEEPQVP